MKELATMLHHYASRAVAAVVWRYRGRALAVIAGAIVVAVIIVHGESWAIREAPLLLTPSSVAFSADAGCLPGDSADGGALPVAILH